MISPADLDYFVTIAGTGHLSRAADRLGVTQPTLSHSLKKMENILDVELFQRSKQGMKLTAAGKRLLQSAKNMKLQWEQLAIDVKNEVDQPHGLIRLGCHPALAQYILPGVLPDLLKNFTGMNFQVSHGLSRHVTEDLISDKLDVVFSINPVRHDDFIIKEIGTDIVTLWCSKTVKNKDVLLFDPSLRQSQDILMKLQKQKNTFARHIHMADLTSITKLMIAGSGYAILPERVVKAHDTKKQAKKISGAPIYKDKICLVYKSAFRKTKRGQEFINAALNAL